VITVSILGAGFMGSAHAANYAALDGRVRVKSVCARGVERAERVAASVGAEALTDLDAAVTDPAVDAVDICLPTALHREAAERAFAAGKHVFLEKPIALSLEDADAIMHAAAASGRSFMVGLVLRFWPEYVELQRRVAAGELGRPLSVTTHRLSPPVDWNEWMADTSQSGGVPVDLLVHDFDQMNWLLGSPQRAFARTVGTGGSAHVLALVEYEGAEGSAEGSMLMPSSYPFSSNIRVLCERGVAEYAFRAEPAPEGGNIGAADPAARGLRLYRSGAEPETVPVESADPWGPEIAYFVECVEQGRVPEEGTAEQARAALEVALTANRSIESGRPEQV
jgi:UDP-N-acetylglucosamine 3-dehydrogenase